VADAAARFLQAKAVERKLSGPAVVTKRKSLLKLVAQPYGLEGADLAKYGVAFRQRAVSGRFREWDPRHGRSCPHCSKPGHFAGPATCSSVTRLLRLSWRRGPLFSVALPRSVHGKTWSSFCVTLW
jgi:hypothetical protein